MNRNPTHLIAFLGRDIKQASRAVEIGEGFECWDLRQFTFEGFVALVQEKIPPVNRNVLKNYVAPVDGSQFGITEREFKQAAWALLVPIAPDDAVASSFAETMFLLNLYSPDFVYPNFGASDFGLRRLAAATSPPITAGYDDRSQTFLRSQFPVFFNLLLPQSKYGTWQLDRAQKWNKEDWRLFVAAKLYSELIQYDNQKDAFGWQREAAEMSAALEALFTAGDSQNEEVGYRLRKRIAVLLNQRFPQIEKDTKDLYGQRSAFMHGSFFKHIAEKSRLSDGGPPLPGFDLLQKHKEYIRWALVAYLKLAMMFRSRPQEFGEAKNVMGALENALIDMALRSRLVAMAEEAMTLLPKKELAASPEREQTVLVFQYGSNMSSERMNSADRLKGDARDLGLVRTVRHCELEFDVWSTSNNCGASDIREGGDRQVWGVLCEVPEYLLDRKTAKTRGRKSLDAIEGKHYARRTIAVQRPDGTVIDGQVITYTVIHPEGPQRTSLAYAMHLLTGLREHDAPDEYIRYVKQRIVNSNPVLAEEVDGH